MSCESHKVLLPGADREFEPLDGAQREARHLLAELKARLQGRPGAAVPRGFLDRLGDRLRVRVRSLGEGAVPGLYLWGEVGRGKTFLMDWFYCTLDCPDKRRVHFHHFMRDVHAAMARLPKQADPLETVAAQWRAQVRVLCLDEFVVTDVADAMILHRLLRGLLSRGMTLVLTSNARPDDLYRNGLQRQSFLPAIELLKTQTRVFELAGERDYRLRNLTEAGVYFAGPGGEARLLEHFAHLTGGHRVADETLTVNGRPLPARHLGPDVAWFDFQVLCGTPRSAADYIEIARVFHTVLLSGVPVFSPAQESAARRFVHLIDEFYDRRVKLVIAAAAPIPELYGGGFLDFPFARLQSRLWEMQSVAYLAAPGKD